MQRSDSSYFRIEIIKVPLKAPQNAAIVNGAQIFTGLTPAPRECGSASGDAAERPRAVAVEALARPAAVRLLERRVPRAVRSREVGGGWPALRLVRLVRAPRVRRLDAAALRSTGRADARQQPCLRMWARIRFHDITVYRASGWAAARAAATA